MPTLWFSKDGKRPHTQRGPGTPISMNEAEAIFKKEGLRFCGPEAPNINPDQPSDLLKNVVVELEKGEEVSALFPQPGFYYVAGIKPPAVESKLSELRAAK